MNAVETSATTARRLSVLELMKSYVNLTKPRINVMMIFTAYATAVIANGGFLDLKTSLVLIVGLGLSVAGAAAINMWYDRDIDAVMARTVNRPIPQGILPAKNALIFGVVLQIMSLATFLIFSNLLSALFSFAGFFYYAVIYTMLLKRKTTLNTVIGGGAGAFPPLIGWAVVTGNISWAAVLMFFVIFFWSPPHFWSLSLLKWREYKRAKVPMLPVVKGVRTTKIQSLIHTVILGFVSVALAFTEPMGDIYLIAAILASALFFIFNVMMWQEDDHKLKWAKRTFKASLLYLPLLFMAMVVSALTGM